MAQKEGFACISFHLRGTRRATSLGEGGNLTPSVTILSFLSAGGTFILPFSVFLYSVWPLSHDGKLTRQLPPEGEPSVQLSRGDTGAAVQIRKNLV